MSDDEIDDRLMVGVYANECRVGQNLIEFMIDFGQRHQENKVIYHTRIVTTPFGMGEFVATMLEALKAHRKRVEGSEAEEQQP